MRYVSITGPDKEQVGQVRRGGSFQASARALQGKGIRYVDEYVIRKVGKSMG